MTRIDRKRGKARRTSPAQQAANQQALQLALQHHGAGNLAQAQALYQQLLQSDPYHPDALHYLGVLAYQQGVLDDAVDLISKSLVINAKNPDAHYNLAKAYKDQGNLTVAIASYRKALAIRPDVDTHFNLANAYKELEVFPEAAEQYRAALALKPDYAEAFSNLGQVEWEMANVDTAIANYQSALSIDPQMAKVYYNLADTFDRSSRLDDLRDIVAAANEHCPGDPLTIMAEAVLLNREKDFAGARARLESLDVSSLEENVVAKRAHLMGLICDRLDEASAAFEHFKAAHAYYQKTAHNRGVDATRYQLWLEAHKKRFSADWVGGWEPFTPIDGRPDPVFLVGFPRSGTTLLDTILRSHPSVSVVEEPPTVARAYEAINLVPEKGNSAFERLKNKKSLQAFRDAYFKELDSHIGPEGRGHILIDKMPLNAAAAGVLKRVFPTAKFLLALRHPCDCVLSCFMQNFTYNDAMANFYTIDGAAKLYDQVFSLWEQYQGILDLDIHTVRYEDLVVDMESEISPLLGFLGLEWDDAVRDYAATAKNRRRIKTPSYNQVTEKLYTRASGRWVRYRDNMEPVLPLLRPWAEKFGYEV